MATDLTDRLYLFVLGVHGVLAAALLVVGLVSGGGADGWADLARVAAVALVAVYVVGIVLSWLVCRFLLRAAAVRVVVAVLGPPLVVTLAIALLRMIG